MAVTGQAGRVNAGTPGSGIPGGQAPLPGPGVAAARVIAAAARAIAAAVRAPFTARSRRELVFCLAELPFVLSIPLVGFYAAAALAWLLTPGNPPNPTWEDLLAGGVAAIAITVLVVVTGTARAIGGWWRALAARLLGAQVAPPPAASRGGRWRRVALRDKPSWRAVAYLLVKLPVALLGAYAVFFWIGGLVNLSFPLWWLSFRNHSPGGHLSPVPVATPFDPAGLGSHFTVATFPGTFAAAATGVAMLLAAPWVTRVAVSADRWLIAGLLGPGRLAQRVQDLEQSRALAVDDSAARLRRLERDLHDGAQIRLATLAMNLGLAKDKLGADGQVPDTPAVRELVDAALRDTKEAIGELRDLARGIHPPVLDNGLPDALETLAAGSAVPAELEVSIPVRPTPAIEAIAYFCVAELLANAVKHSGADKITIRAARDGDTLRLSVSDNGTGGAEPQRGSGLAGLRQRVAVVDGSLAIVSPPGGPTRVGVDLPLRA
jgi:signal transduction histidine kinase